MSVVPFDKHDREDMSSTLSNLQKGINEGEVTGFIVICKMTDGTNSHAHNCTNKDMAEMIGLLELKKHQLIERVDDQ
jgi:hypothetical protein